MPPLLRCSLLLLPWCFLLTLQADEPKDELEVQLGCTIQYHKVPAKQPKTWVIPEQMLVRVTDAGKNPLPGAGVCLNARFPEDTQEYDSTEKRENDPKTDQNGTVVLSLEEYRNKTLREILVTVTCGENHLPFRYTWQDRPLRYRYGWQDIPTKTDEPIVLPAELEVALEPGEMVTYTVLDENGKGIAGVKIETSIGRNTMPGHFFSSRYETISDAEGEFQVGPLALETGREKVERISLRHPDYARMKFSQLWPWEDEKKTLKEKLVPLTLTMPPGHTLSGIVIDHEDEPIEGVIVDYQDITHRDYWLDGSMQTQTDGEGRFHFGSLRKGEYKLRATRKYADPVTVDLATISELVKIVVKPTSTVRVRAVSEDGEVLPKIRVFGLFSDPDFGGTISERNSRTLEDGTWECFEIPTDKNTFFFVLYDNNEFNDGYHHIRGYVSEKEANTPPGEWAYYKFPPREEPYIVKMLWKDVINPRFTEEEFWTVHRKMAVRVLDSETGLPVSHVPVMMQYGTGLGTEPGSAWRSSWDISHIMQEYSTDQNGLVALDFSDVNRKEILFIEFKIELDDFVKWEFRRSADPEDDHSRRGAPIPPIIDAFLFPAQGLKEIEPDENRK